ncbi:ribosome assembly cofactor RimP [Flavobacterium orientale]|uniref:Ribosome maturation factor RimP n=1 Tax=Flavobacterium orientale TaxID=1756020 RepID=A0A916Y7T0_9FLAO|nr:ribosome assembly cofactor RimP [Flavobacterium orientale]GGD33895.1 ribosome maturation factor RimP [Flavobacterium orientale]
MVFKDKVFELLKQGLEEKPELFLIDFSISDANKINVILDGDHGVTLQDCIDISRAIEHNLDREEVDFSLEVASAGVSTPLKSIRQYKKNIGRVLQVKTNSEIYEATLDSVSDEAITLSWTAREPKKVGKGKETVKKMVKLPFSEIKEALVIIIF